MDFVHYDLGLLKPGQVVEVSLGIAANVLLLDTANFDAYRRGDRYTYYGGHVTQTPYRIPIPSPGYWHVALDLGGAPGSISSSVRVLG
jgi:Domain of unknown function (DUF1883)